MKKLESEVEELRSLKDSGGRRSGLFRSSHSDLDEALPERSFDGRGNQGSQRTEDEGFDLGEAAAKGAAAAAVITSRLMQLASFLLMASMTLVMVQSFWEHGQALGDIRLVAAERNYGLALYAGFAGTAVFMGAVWSLWILSRKGAGGGIRMKKYDTGRGFLPFLLCIAAIAAAALLPAQIPQEAEAWKGLAKGAADALEAVNSQREILLLCSGVGAVLSLIRRLLRV